MNHITSLLRGIMRTHVVLGLIFTAAIIQLLAGNRQASEAAAAPTVRNVVLVHGAFADGSSWAKVIPLLEAKGLRVTAVHNPSKIDEATRVHYTAFYAQPGAMHSAFAQFLSIPKDAEDNKVSMTTKLTMPVLAIGGAKSFGANVAIVMRNAADNVTEVMIANSGHWLMEEQPTATIAAVHNFLDRKTTTQSH